MASEQIPDGNVKAFHLEGLPLPLVVESLGSGGDFEGWAAAHQDWISGRLLQHGALLFRGFDLREVADFERALTPLVPRRVSYFEGSSPRHSVKGTVYNSTDYPSELPISMHNEMSYAHRWPGRICFFCHTPAEQGGETPLADSRTVYRLIPPKVRQPFEERGVRYVRSLHGGQGAGLAWQTVFETADRAAVERYCQEGGIELQWTEDGGVRTRQQRPAVVSHPRTGERLWFNQAHIFHPSDLGEEDAEDLLEIFGEEGLPTYVYLGNGAQIELADLRQIRAAYERATVRFPWQQGDLLLVDNMLVSHGRMPFSGPRKILVGMGEPVGLADLS